MAYLQNEKKVFIINGYAEKADSNFLPEFCFSHLGESGIIIGNFPESEQQIKSLRKEGVSAVLNLMTKEEQSYLQFDWKKVLKFLNSNGILVAKNFSLDDGPLVQSEYPSFIFQAA
jgi:hypothetical protein